MVDSNIRFGLASILTYRCNSRCAHCLIWQRSPDEPELSLSQYKAIFQSPISQAVKSLSISGGEPFCRADVEAVLRSVPKEIPLLVGTNALLNERIEGILSRVRAVRPIAVQVSIDGMEETHDRVRGVSGNFQKSLSLLDWCRREALPATVSFTFGSDNYQDLLKVSQLASEMKAHFAFRPVNVGGFYGNADRECTPAQFNNEQLDHIERDILSLIRSKRKNGYYDQRDFVFWGYAVDYLRRAEGFEFPRCHAAESFYLVDPSGTLFPCPQYWEPMGNILDWPNVFASERRKKVAGKVKSLDCGGCWNDCFIWNSLDREPQWVNRKHRELLQTKLGLPEEPSWDLHPGDADAVRNLGYGWHACDSGASRWIGREASFYSSLAERLHVEVSSPCPTPEAGPGSLEIWISERCLGRLEFDFCGEKIFSLAIPEDLRREQPLEVILRCQKTWSPHSLGMSDDQRELGVAVIRIWSA